MTPLRLAWSNMRHRTGHTLVALLGLTAVVLLVFMQLGFLDAVRRSASLLYGQLDFDLIILSEEYVNLGMPGTLPRSCLAQARSVPGVEAIHPLTATTGMWRGRRPVKDAQQRDVYPEWSIMLLAVDPDQLGTVFDEPVGRLVRSKAELAGYADLLRRSDNVLIDRSSRPEYGDAATWRPGSRNELNGQAVQVVGDVQVGTGFGYSALLILSEDALSRLTAWSPREVTFGLVKLEGGSQPSDPGHLTRARREVARALPPGTARVLTRDELYAQETEYWMSQTAIGRFFEVGVWVAFAVGAIFVYQMVAADISNNLPEFATVRALGYKGFYLSRVVIYQGLLLALVGYIPGLALALIGYLMTYVGSGVPITMTWERIGSVLGLTVLICLASTVLAIRLALKADPADLF